MPHKFEQPAQNYRNPEEFQESAIKTLNQLHGRRLANGKRGDLETFDFSVAQCKEHDIPMYVCVGYHPGERVPAAQAPGVELSSAQSAAIATADFLKAVKTPEPKAGVSVTKGAAEFAAKNDVDLLKVTGTGPDGRIMQPDVVAYLKQQAPEKDKADNGNDGQQ